MNKIEIIKVPLRKEEIKTLIKALDLLVNQEEDVNDYTLLYNKLRLVK